MSELQGASQAGAASASPQRDEAGVQDGRAVTRREATAVLVASCGEALITAIAVATHLPVFFVLMLHALVTGACAIILFFKRQPAADLSLAWVMMLLLAVAGPAGALVLLSSLPFVRARPESWEIVEAWYDRLARAGKPSDTTQMYERIVSGRVQRAGMEAPLDFLEVIRSGNMEQRQRALGLIARHFHPDYAPVLDAALRSPEPVVRVQAAAVVARVREDIKAKIAYLVREEQRTPGQALHDAGLLHTLQACPLVASAQQAMCRDGVRRLMREAFTPGEDILSADPRTGGDSLRALETFFISERRYRELRVLRRVRNSRGHSLRVIRRRSGVRRLAA